MVRGILGQPVMPWSSGAEDAAMHERTDLRMPARMRRRTLLGLAVAAAAVPVTTGCTSSADSDADPSPSTDESTDDSQASIDTSLRIGAVAAETELIDRYDATIAAHPALAAGLTPLADQHREHRVALQSQPAPNSQTSPAGVNVSSDPAIAVNDIIAAERTAADARTLDCERAESVELTRLLALIAASEASHAEALSSTNETS